MSKKVKINQNKKQDPFNFAPKIKEILTNFRKEIDYLGQSLANLDSAFCSYIEFNGNGEEWKESVIKRVDEIRKKHTNKEEIIADEPGSKKSGESSGGTGDNKTRKKTSRKQNK